MAKDDREDLAKFIGERLLETLKSRPKKSRMTQEREATVRSAVLALRLRYLQGNSQIPNIRDRIDNRVLQTLEILRKIPTGVDLGKLIAEACEGDDYFGRSN